MHLNKETKALFTTPCARCVKKLESWLAVQGKRIRECVCPCSTAEFAHLRRGGGEARGVQLESAARPRFARAAVAALQNRAKNGLTSEITG